MEHHLTREYGTRECVWGWAVSTRHWCAHLYAQLGLLNPNNGKMLSSLTLELPRDRQWVGVGIRKSPQLNTSVLKFSLVSKRVALLWLCDCHYTPNISSDYPAFLGSEFPTFAPQWSQWSFLNAPLWQPCVIPILCYTVCVTYTCISEQQDKPDSRALSLASQCSFQLSLTTGTCHTESLRL